MNYLPEGGWRKYKHRIREADTAPSVQGKKKRNCDAELLTGNE